MESIAVELPESTTTEELLATINDLNNNPNVHGILLQHPVPSQIEKRMLDVVTYGGYPTDVGPRERKLLSYQICKKSLMR